MIMLVIPEFHGESKLLELKLLFVGQVVPLGFAGKKIGQRSSFEKTRCIFPQREIDPSFASNTGCPQIDKSEPQDIHGLQ
jgi:hypothetical protein